MTHSDALRMRVSNRRSLHRITRHHHAGIEIDSSLCVTAAATSFNERRGVVILEASGCGREPSLALAADHRLTDIDGSKLSLRKGAFFLGSYLAKHLHCPLTHHALLCVVTEGRHHIDQEMYPREAPIAY